MVLLLGLIVNKKFGFFLLSLTIIFIIEQQKKMYLLIKKTISLNSINFFKTQISMNVKLIIMLARRMLIVLI